MLPIQFTRTARPLKVLCLGAHSDDIEIGVAATILGWIDSGHPIDVTWCVLSAAGKRREEALAGAAAVLAGAHDSRVELAEFRDGYFPSQSEAIKEWIEDLKSREQPDVIFTHRGDDGHQDHREVSRLTWNAFRDQVILEYEIPKWDGDIGRPNFYIPISAVTMDRTIDVLMSCFGSQRSKDWFDPEIFRGLARIRGMECRAPERYAGGFFARKLCLS